MYRPITAKQRDTTYRAAGAAAAMQVKIVTATAEMVKNEPIRSGASGQKTPAEAARHAAPG